MQKKKDTIFALATPRGKSALATIRISGPEAFNVVKKISSNMPKKPNTSAVNNIFSNKKLIIDKTITTYFKKPKSYTGEDMVEISTHGSHAVIKKVVETLNQNKKIRFAEAGEFTRRAFENNKLDLTQVEAVADIVNSETESQRKQAQRQLDGELSKKTNTISEKILKVLANIEAIIDFSDEDLPEDVYTKSKEQIENICNDLIPLVVGSEYGEKIRTGFLVTIIGKTNTGKSSFINKISQRDISIVTDEPGTTRDIIESSIDFKGVLIKFYDTAGLRPSKNKAENIGIKKAVTMANKSDLNLVFLNKKNEIHQYKKIMNPIFVISKSDLINKNTKKYKEINYISSHKGTGIQALLRKIYKKLSIEEIEEDFFVSRERHKNLLKNTLKFLEFSKNKKNIDVFAEDLRSAFNEISKITGKKDVEDILDIIFNDFCIGK